MGMEFPCAPESPQIWTEDHPDVRSGWHAESTKPRPSNLARAREIMRPFRAKSARANDALVRTIVLKNRAERHLASSEVWQRQALDLVAEVAEERALFLEAVAKLPPHIASAPAVVNIDLATSRLLATLNALEPVRKHLAAHRQAGQLLQWT